LKKTIVNKTDRYNKLILILKVITVPVKEKREGCKEKLNFCDTRGEKSRHVLEHAYLTSIKF